MGDLVNLNKAKKARAKDQKKKQADSNRVIHGQSKAEKSLRKAKGKLADANLNAHKRARSDENED